MPQRQGGYAIVSQSDIRDALIKLEAGHQQENAESARVEKEQIGQTLGRISANTTHSDKPSLPPPIPIN